MADYPIIRRHLREGVIEALAHAKVEVQRAPELFLAWLPITRDLVDSEEYRTP